MEKPKRAANYSRTKGHRAEQEYAIRFRELGYEFCLTARQASRLHDDCGIDLYGIPFNVQIKSGFKKNRPNAEKLFREMKELLKKKIAPSDSIHARPKLLIHKAQSYTPEGELVTMTWDDFIPFLKAYKQLQDGSTAKTEPVAGTAIVLESTERNQEHKA